MTYRLADKNRDLRTEGRQESSEQKDQYDAEVDGEG